MTNRATDYSGEGATDPRRGAADIVGDRIKDASEKVQDVADRARQYSEKAQEAALQFKPFVKRSLKDQPMATLAGAALIGFVLGALWKR